MIEFYHGVDDLLETEHGEVRAKYTDVGRADCKGRDEANKSVAVGGALSLRRC